MQQEIRFATFNTFNLAPPGVKLYDNLALLTEEEYEAKLAWTAHQIDLLDADVIGFQEIFSQDVLRAALARTERYRDAHHIGVDPAPGAERPVPNVALVTRLPLAALISALFAPFYYGLLFGVDEKLFAIVAMSMLLGVRHSKNISNLLAGKESRLGAKPAAPAAGHAKKK